MRKRIGEVRPALAALLALAWAPALFGGAIKEVVATWEELPPLVERREIETVLANGVHIRGRVEKVLPEALEVRVKRTSDAKLAPKGRTRVPRELIGALTVRWKQGPARALLTLAAILGYAGLLRPAADPPFDTHEMGPAEANALFFGMVVAAYLVGSKIDAKSIRLLVSQDPYPQGTPALIEPKEGKRKEP